MLRPTIMTLFLIIGLQLFARAAQADDVLQTPAQFIVAEHLTGLVKTNKAQLNRTSTEAFRAHILDREQEYKAYYSLVKPLLSEHGGYLIEQQWEKTERNQQVSCFKASARGMYVYFYLIKSGIGWQIDIVRSDVKQSLSMARCEYYLGTKYDWRDDVSKTLRAVRVAYQVQQAIDTYTDRRGAEPARLYGLGQQNDPLIQVGLIKDRYPNNPFEGKPVQIYGLARKNPVGSMGYYKIAKENTSLRYILVLYGLESGVEDYSPVLAGTNIIMVLSDGEDKESDIGTVKSILEQTGKQK